MRPSSFLSSRVCGLNSSIGIRCFLVAALPKSSATFLQLVGDLFAKFDFRKIG